MYFIKSFPRALAFIQCSFVVLFVEGDASQSTTCQLVQGSPGTPGAPGVPGTAGAAGVPGIPGSPGAAGRDGTKGSKGEVGPKGDVGSPGPSTAYTWKQCAWKNTNSDKNSGLIHQCKFKKLHSYTYLRVVFQGPLRIRGCTFCCMRWFFTFNGKECTNPLPIDAIIYHSSNINIHRSTTVEGYCGGIQQGSVNVGFSVGKCGGSTGGDAYTSWNSVSRIIIEEVPPQQS